MQSVPALRELGALFAENRGTTPVIRNKKWVVKHTPLHSWFTGHHAGSVNREEAAFFVVTARMEGLWEWHSKYRTCMLPVAIPDHDAVDET